MRFDPATHTVHAAGRSWQADPRSTSIEDRSWETQPGYVHHDRRCVVRFESGWAASIIWGSGTYSTNHDAWGDTPYSTPFTEDPTTVEVGVLDHRGQLRQRRHIDDDGTEWHDLEAYVDDPGLAALLDELAALPTDADYGIPPPTMDEVRDAFDALADEVRKAGRDVPEWPT